MLIVLVLKFLTDPKLSHHRNIWYGVFAYRKRKGWRPRLIHIKHPQPPILGFGEESELLLQL